jgi:hypothetical protein
MPLLPTVYHSACIFRSFLFSRDQEVIMRAVLFFAVTLAAYAVADSTTTNIGYFGINSGLAADIGPFFFTSTAASVAGINALATTY